jgi:all-trans-8'-apo-beta-carotenal 15,15'-oxygenase
MTASIDRRTFVGSALFAGAGAAASIITPDRALAGAAPAGWALGVADVDADITEAPMTLVRGRAPDGLGGTLYRNGPAKFRRGGGAATHWFDGDGLIRKFRLNSDRATLAAKFVDTPKRRLEAKLDAMVMPGFGSPRRDGATLSSPDDGNAANTALLMAGDDLLALWEAGSPARIDPETLGTRGFKTFRDDLAHMPFLAHPRVQPDGVIWNIGSGGGKDCFVWKLNADGSLNKAEAIKLPRPSYYHDFTATARHLVIVLQPWLQESFKFPLASGMAWRPERGTQVLVIDKDDFSKQRIFELPAFSFFHLGDAWEESDGTIRFDGALESDPTFGQTVASALLRGEYMKSPTPMLTQIILRPNGRADMVASKVSAEFPATDKRFAGLPRRYTTHVTAYRRTPFAHGIAQWDWQRGRDDRFDFGDHHLVEEFVFAPRGAEEGNGWLIGTTLNLKARATELHVLDARQVSAGPLATWRANVPLPHSFHGIFVPKRA